MKTTLSIGRFPLACAFFAALSGCTVYVAQPPQAQQTYTPPPPQPAPAYVEATPAPPPPAPAVVVIQSDDDFYAPLSAYGQWVDAGSFGRCWRPAQVEAGWRPYANGHWELTDNGWYWESDEPWAWATYHYGRWEMTSDYGWIWIPQTEWAPAWVSWRSGGGYVGWAPLPVERPGISIDVVIAPERFCFVEEAHMHDPVRPTTVIVNNTTIINQTVVINKTTIVNKVVVNQGPRSDEVERVSGRKFQTVALKDLRQRDEEPVAEKHPNLRHQVVDRNPPPLARKPEPRQEIPPQNARNDDRQQPVAQPLRQEQPKPSRNEQPQARPVPAEFQPPPARPETQPADNRNNRERVQPNHPPANNQGRDTRTPERPVNQPLPDANARERQPQRQPQPEAQQRPTQPERQRQTEQPLNSRNAQERGNQESNSRGRENSRTNSVDAGNSRNQR